MKNKLFVYFGIAVFLIGAVGIAYAAFSDRGDVQGTTISVGSADLKILDDLGGNVDPSNLLDEKGGPSYQNIGSDWSIEYPIQLFNNGTGQISLFSTADYETANDPQDLREEVEVEIFAWDDLNSDGNQTPDEIGTSFGKKTIVKWKTEGFDLGNMDTGEVRGFIIEFSTTELPDSYQGASLMFDFGFDSASLE